MKEIADYLALVLRWVLMAACLLCGAVLALTALVMSGLDGYDLLKHGSADFTALSALTGPTGWVGLQKILDHVPLWIFIFLLAGGLMWLSRMFKLDSTADHYLLRRRHKRAARKLGSDWEARKREAERPGQES